jgi:prepilin-type processing-associated H-X9-DG protein
MFNIAYVDGHAKSMGWHAGISSVVAGHLIVAPRNTADQGKWCADPTAEIVSPLGNMPCGRVVPAIVAAGVKWFVD